MFIRTDVYTLPEIAFVAGQSQKLCWRLYNRHNAPFDTGGCRGRFAVVDYSCRWHDPLMRDPLDSPLITKPLQFMQGPEGIENVAYVDLLPTDTLDRNRGLILFGKFIYQLTIEDILGNIEIPNHGILQITYNVDKEYLNDRRGG